MQIQTVPRLTTSYPAAYELLPRLSMSILPRCLIAMLFALAASCTSTREVHVGMPTIPANLARPDAPMVYLRPAIDSRPSDVIAHYDEVWLADKYTGGTIGPSYNVAAGGELAEYTNALAVGYLGMKGFRAQRIEAGGHPTPPAPMVQLKLVAAQGSLTERNFMAPAMTAPGGATADIEVNVTDDSRRELYSNSYSAIVQGNAPKLVVPFMKTVVDADKRWLDLVNQAVEATIKNMVADPAFIAAISPPATKNPGAASGALLSWPAHSTVEAVR